MMKDKPNKPKRPAKKSPQQKSRLYTTDKPFTLHINDTPENVVRALFGNPLKRE